MKKLVMFVISGLIVLSLLPSPAFAYLDPGTGSAILQGILGALAAIAVALKLYWHKLLRLLGIRKKIDDPAKETKDVNKNQPE